MQVRTFLTNPRTRIVCGVLLLTFAVLMAIAFVSFFFSGANDQSILDLPRSESKQLRLQIQNWLGLPGAALSRVLIDRAFGIMSFLLVLMLTLYGLLMVRAVKVRPLSVLLHCTFWLVWGSVSLSFLQNMFAVQGFFRWGGSHGEALSTWATSYIQPLGLFIVLLVVLIIYAVVADPNFVPHCRLIWGKIKAAFEKKQPETTPADTPIDLPISDTDDADQPADTDTSVEITLEIDSANDTQGISKGSEIIVDIENTHGEEVINIDDPAEDEHIDAPSDDTTTDTEDNPADGFEAATGEEVELADDDPETILRKLGPFDPRKDLENYRFPSLDLLKVYPNETAPVINQEEQQANANRIVTALRTYGIEIEQIKATVGPTVTLYEVVPKAGTRVNKIQALENDIMMSLAANGIRILAPIPGKSAVGIEVPNEKPQTVSMHSVIASKRFQEEQKMRLPIAIGRTITNEVFMFDLAKTPHLLVAGATGQGKSVAINAIITSLLYKKHPAEMKLVMVDPKMVEFAPYKPLLRHYLAAMPDVDLDQVVITECDRVINTLNSLVIEMENRYKLLMDAGVRNLEDYNDKFIARRLNPQKVVGDNLHHQFLPYIVIIIDEYGDFIMQAGKQVETPIARITQKARAVGMHMILATQRPSVNIVTGVIKANIPTRIALRTQSVIDSRTVLDAKGADQLIGRGDMLYAGNGNITRIQCAFVDTPEVDQIVEHIQKQQHYFEPYQLPEYVGEGGEGEALAPGSVDMKRLDPMFADVARYVVTKQEGSTSRLQRAFEIGYNRAGKLSDQLEAAGIVGPNKGPKGRDVLIQDLSALDEILSSLGC